MVLRNVCFFALQFFVSLMCRIKSVLSVCVSSIDLVVAFSAHTHMGGCTCLFTSLYMQIPKASLCTESISQKSYALVGLPELTILTLADSKEGTACCDFGLQA